MKRLKWCCRENAAGALYKIITREKLVVCRQQISRITLRAIIYSKFVKRFGELTSPLIVPSASWLDWSWFVGEYLVANVGSYRARDMMCIVKEFDLIWTSVAALVAKLSGWRSLAARLSLPCGVTAFWANCSLWVSPSGVGKWIVMHVLHRLRRWRRFKR